MTNSRESTSIIISIPPGKTLLVVISRSLCECHMKANPASESGGFATVPEGGVVPVLPTARTVSEDGRIRQSCRTATCNVAEWVRLHWLVVILAPLEIVDCSGGAGVVAVHIRGAGQRRPGGSVVTIRIPVQTFAGPVEDCIHREAGSCCRGEEQRSSKIVRVGRAENQIA